MKMWVFILFLMMMPLVCYSQSTNTLASEIILLKQNNVSDEVILAYIQLQSQKQKEKKSIDVESYEFFYIHYLYPRVLKSRQQYIESRPQRRFVRR